MAYYLDTSALVKLVVAEPESPALHAWAIEAERTPVCSDLVRTELVRAVRLAAPDRSTQARELLLSLTLLSATSAILDRAAVLEPRTLRSLDSIHIATAMELGDDLDSVVTYDHRMVDGCRALGLHTSSPGAGA